MNRPDEKMFTALARAAEHRVDEFSAQELANTTWAFATVNQPDKKLPATLARTAEPRMSEETSMKRYINSRSLANIVC